MFSQSLIEETIITNNELRRNVDAYYEKLRKELDSVNANIANVEKLSDDNLQVGNDDKWCLHADGAYKPIGAIELGHSLKPQSPFYEEAARQERYMKFILPNPFSAAERRYLEKAVVKENKRLMALHSQQEGQNPLEVLPAENEAFLDNLEGLDWSAIARDVSTWNYPGDARTAQDCKGRWLAQHPRLNYENWTDEENKKLREIVQNMQTSGDLNWDALSTSLGTNRTPLDCIRQYQANTKTVLKWTDELDRKLSAAVEKYGYSNWALVAPAVSLELSPNQCQIRYERTLNPSLKHGKFTSEEDEMLLKAIEIHACEWKKVAQMVPGRSNTQCRSRYLSLGRRKERQAKKTEMLDAPTPMPTLSFTFPVEATAEVENGISNSPIDNEETGSIANASTSTKEVPDTQPRRGPKARIITPVAKDTIKSTHHMRTRSSANSTTDT